MTFLARTIWGSAAGALAVLVLHPLTRQYFDPIAATSRSARIESTALLPEHPAGRAVETREDAAFEMLRAAIHLQDRAPAPSQSQLQSWQRLAHNISSKEPDNAFWPQMEYVLSEQMGDRVQAKEAWSRAARCARWDDDQSVRVRELIPLLPPLAKRDQAWKFLFAFYERSPLISDVISREGKKISDPDDSQKLTTIRNGILLRNGAETIQSYSAGVGLIESSVSQLGKGSAKHPHLTRFQEIARGLYDAGRVDDALLIERAERDNIAWRALFEVADEPSHAPSLFWQSLATASLPSALTSGCLIGAFVFLAGLVIDRMQSVKFLIGQKWAPILGIVLGIAVGVMGASLFAAVFIVGGFSFFQFTPEAVRTGSLEGLGRGFHRIIALAVGLTLIFWILTWIPATSAGYYLAADRVFANPSALERFGPVPYFIKSARTPLQASAVGAVGTMILVLVFMAPAWTLRKRFSPHRVVAEALRVFGRQMAALCLILAVLVGPILVILDIRLSARTAKLMDSEPKYIFNQ